MNLDLGLEFYLSDGFNDSVNNSDSLKCVRIVEFVCVCVFLHTARFLSTCVFVTDLTVDMPQLTGCQYVRLYIICFLSFSLSLFLSVSLTLLLYNYSHIHMHIYTYLVYSW